MSEPIALYPLDRAEFTIEIKAGKHTLRHKLRKPTLSELIERENDSFYETEAVSDSEEKVNAEDEAANGRLWNKIAVSVQGYKLHRDDPTPQDAFVAVSDQYRAAIPASHKATAVRGLYQFTTEIETTGDEDGFVLSGDTWTIKQTIGGADDPAYIIRHILNTPTEAQRREFRRKASDVRFSKGSKRIKTKVVTHLRAHVELYDALMQGVEGVTVENGAHFNAMESGSNIKPTIRHDALKGLIDPIWKRSVIDTLMREFEAGLSD